MALRHRTAVTVNIDTENPTKLAPGKAGLQQLVKGVTRRPALGEVGNRINSIQNNEIRKPLIPSKPVNVCPFKPKIEKENPCVKKEKNENVTKKDKATLKREESKLHIDVIPKSYSLKQLELVDPDANSQVDSQAVVEYVMDIYSYLRDLEDEFPIHKDFLVDHSSSAKMRSILINWLVEVHQNFKGCLETLHLCVSIVDRYLQENKKVGRDTLQLVGTSAMLIASKYEEMYMPDIDDFVYICDNTFAKRQILRMEIDILKRLEFNLGRPLSIHFLRRYSKLAQVVMDVHTLGKYILELSMMEHEMSTIKPSVMAAAASCLSMAIMNETMEPTKLWTPTLIHYTTYEYKDFKHVVVGLAKVIVKAETSRYQSIRKKYASSKYGKISLNTKLSGSLVKSLSSRSSTSPADKK